MTVRIEATFAYRIAPWDAAATPRNERRGFRVGVSEFLLPVYARRDAAPAMSVFKSVKASAPVQVDYVALRGRLARPVLDRHGSTVPAARLGEGSPLRERYALAHQDENPLTCPSRGWVFADDAATETDADREVHATAREARLRGLGADGGLLLMDGDLWRWTDEPTWRVHALSAMATVAVSPRVACSEASFPAADDGAAFGAFLSAWMEANGGRKMATFGERGPIEAMRDIMRVHPLEALVGGAFLHLARDFAEFRSAMTEAGVAAYDAVAAAATDLLEEPWSGPLLARHLSAYAGVPLLAATVDPEGCATKAAVKRLRQLRHSLDVVRLACETSGLAVGLSEDEARDLVEGEAASSGPATH